jgi:hypothetical protein
MENCLVFLVTDWSFANTILKAIILGNFYLVYQCFDINLCPSMGSELLSGIQESILTFNKIYPSNGREFPSSQTSVPTEIPSPHLVTQVES